MRSREIEPKKLVVFDIDDTLVNTQTKVHVVKDNRVVNSLNSHDFTHYKLKPGESFDFEDFRNAREFFEKSRPIIPMMNQLKRDIATGNKVVMVTARADFDDKELFLDTFRKYGIDMDKVHVYRAGNIKGGTTEERKKQIIKTLLNKDNYTKAIMYDDAKPNLHTFIDLKKEHPKTRFYAWHVSLNGEASEYMREGIVAEKKKKRRSRWAAYGPGPYGGYGFAVGYSGDGGVSGGDGGGVGEASYPGNLGMMELAKFFQIADSQQKALFQQLLEKGKKGLAWKLVQDTVGVKLQGKEFEDQHPNEKPRGPEIKPTMPKGTVKVDVSDVYDWYKLGQHISNLKGLGKHDFGKGPPSTILSFGDEDEEHEYIKNLLKTGLKTTDIDPKAHEKKKGQKTDPTYNVGENSTNDTGTKKKSSSTIVDAISDFLPLAIKYLKLKSLPKINFSRDVESKHDQPTFGVYHHDHDTKLIELDIEERHPIDIIRTLAHELVHYKQDLEGRLSEKSWRTGSPTENEAHDKAGIMMRIFDKQHPKYLKMQAVEFNENFADGKVKGKSRPGRVKRAGASCAGSVTDLRKRAKNSSGEKAKMYHWCANMKSGRDK